MTEDAEMAAGFGAALELTRKAVADQTAPTFAEMVAELEEQVRDAIGLGAIKRDADLSTLAALLACVREQQKALAKIAELDDGDERYWWDEGDPSEAMKSVCAILARYELK